MNHINFFSAEQRAQQCRAHLVIPTMRRPCGSLSVSADPLSIRNYLLCDEHLNRLVRAAKKPIREHTVVKTKTRIRTTRTSARDDLKHAINELTAEITTLKAQLSEARSPKRRPTPTDGTVYFLRSGGGHIKIGWTANLADRMKKYPPDSTLLATMPGTRKDEAALHKKFAHHRTHGREWYPLATEITHYIERIAAQHGAPEPTQFAARPVQTPRPHANKPHVTPRGWTGKRRT